MRRYLLCFPCVFFCVVLLISMFCMYEAAAQTAVYKNPRASVEERIEDLLSRMTLEEKIGQINMPCVYVGELGKNVAEKTEAVKKFAAGTYAVGIK